MRFALIVAFVGSVFFHANAVEARSDVAPSAQARKTPKAKKRSAPKAKTKTRTATHKGSKRSHKAPVEADQEVASADDGETPAPAPEVVAKPQAKGPAVAQVTDDEEPANAPKKKR